MKKAAEKRLASKLEGQQQQQQKQPLAKARPGAGKKASIKMKKKKKKLNKEELGKPKKPPTAFFYFLEDFRKVYQEEHPDVKSMRDIGKACGEKWKTMNFEEKVEYYDIATEKRQEFEDAMAAYLKKKESGELLKQLDEDYESDGIFD